MCEDFASCHVPIVVLETESKTICFQLTVQDRGECGKLFWKSRVFNACLNGRPPISAMGNQERAEIDLGK